MKKRTKIIVTILLILMMIMPQITSSYAATFNIDKADLYNKGDCGDLLKYNGALLYHSFIVYQKDGVEYPAYCLQSSLPGVGEKGPYTVAVNELVNNNLVWKTITNGYPYKTPQQLGVANEKEAFAATKQAVYCVLYGNDRNNFSGYQAVGEAGQRTLNALKKIVTTARNSTASKESSQIILTPEGNLFAVDNIDKSCASLICSISSYTINGKYQVAIEGDLPLNTKLTDLNNNPKTEFAMGEKFKILIPIQNLERAGNIQVTVTAAVATKPIFYGKAPSSSMQDYALTAASYEDGKVQKTLTYAKNMTSIKIIKQDGECLAKLPNAVFRLLDENQKVVYTDLKTDEKGEIHLDNLIPGTYYLEEIQAPISYQKYDKQIPVILGFNEQKTITVNNYHEKKVEISINTGNITVNNQNSSIDISNQNNNTNINHNESNININNQNQNTNINDKQTSINQNQSNINVNRNQENINQNSNISQLNQVVKLPKTGM